MASPTASLLLNILLLLSSVIIAGGAEDLQSDRTALLAFCAGFPILQSRWNINASPCSWTGVRCHFGRVTDLSLRGMLLLGPIPAGSVGNLTALRTIRLNGNYLSGTLPLDIEGASYLHSLFLQGNLLSGEIPPVLTSLRRLKHLNLAFNNFSGVIPQQFSNLTHLTTLLLQRNNLSGELPDLDLPMLTQLNLSNNMFTGTIPSRLRKWPANAFLGTELCGSPLPACHNDTSPSSNLPAYVITLIGVSILLVVVVLITLTAGIIYLLKIRNELGNSDRPENGNQVNQNEVDVSSQRREDTIQENRNNGDVSGQHPKNDSTENRNRGEVSGQQGKNGASENGSRVDVSNQDEENDKEEDGNRVDISENRNHGEASSHHHQNADQDIGNTRHVMQQAIGGAIRGWVFDCWLLRALFRLFSR